MQVRLAPISVTLDGDGSDCREGDGSDSDSDATTDKYSPSTAAEETGMQLLLLCCAVLVSHACEAETPFSHTRWCWWR